MCISHHQLLQKYYPKLKTTTLSQKNQGSGVQVWFNRVLWLKVSSKLQWSKAAVMPSLAGKGAWDLPQAHSRSGQQVPFFMGCWTETSAFREPSSRRCPLPGPCHVGLSVRQLTIWQSASLERTGRGQRACQHYGSHSLL